MDFSTIDWFQVFFCTGVGAVGFFIYLYGARKKEFWQEWNSISCKPKASLPVCEECGRVQEEFEE